jgi:hypothetical protein
MNLLQMKADVRNFSIGVAALAAVAAPASGKAAAACADPTPNHTLSYPSFCSIPPAPTGVRDAAAFKAAIVDTRLDGARVFRQTGPETFTLNGTDEFLAEARRAATPPPPLTTPGDSAEAFAKDLRARAKPPTPPK